MKCPECRFSREGPGRDPQNLKGPPVTVRWCLLRANFEGEANGGCESGLPKGDSGYFWIRARSKPLSSTP